MKTYDYPHGVLHISKFGLATITKGKEAANNVEASLPPNDERFASFEPTAETISANVDIVIKTRLKKTTRVNFKEISQTNNPTNVWIKFIHLDKGDEIVSAVTHGPSRSAR